MTKASVRNFVIALLVLLLSVGGFGYMLFQIDKKSDLLREQLTSIELENKRESDFYRLQKTSEESAADRKAVEEYFLPQSSDSIDFLNRVEQLAPQSGVTLKTDGLEEASDKKTKQKWIVASFSFSGTQANVENFLNILETAPYLSRVTSVSLNARSLDNWEAKVTMRVFILGYEI
jgi:hypothetical protein